MTKIVAPQSEYDVKARRISGTHAEKLEQIDAAIQELLDIKLLECASGRPTVQFLAAPRPRSHGVAMTITILVLLIVLALLVGVRTSRAQAAADALPPWHVGGTFDVSLLNSNLPKAASSAVRTTCSCRTSTCWSAHSSWRLTTHSRCRNE